MSAKKVIILMLFAVSSLVFSEDYFPLYTNEALKQVNQSLYKLIETNGVLLSYADNMKIYYLKDVITENEEFKIKKEKVRYNVWNYSGDDSISLIAILINKNGYYFGLKNNSYINLSVLNFTPYPVIYVRFINKQFDCSAAIISKDESGYSIRSFEEFPPNGGNDYGLQKLQMDIQYFVINNQEYSMQRFDNPDLWYIFHLSKGSKRLGQVRLPYIRINDYVSNYARSVDSDVRIRSANSINSSIITKINDNTELRIIFIDPNISTVNNENGNWVLIQTEFSDVGWVWSKYIKGFSFEN